MRAYKLFRLHKDGSLGSLFINCRQRVPLGKWLKAECHPTKGYAVREGWHTVQKPEAPHLSMKGRVWAQVEIEDYEELKRPASQGGLWYIAKKMKVLNILEVMEEIK